MSFHFRNSNITSITITTIIIVGIVVKSASSLVTPACVSSFSPTSATAGPASPGTTASASASASSIIPTDITTLADIMDTAVKTRCSCGCGYYCRCCCCCCCCCCRRRRRRDDRQFHWDHHVVATGFDVDVSAEGSGGVAGEHAEGDDLTVRPRAYRTPPRRDTQQKTGDRTKDKKHRKHKKESVKSIDQRKNVGHSVNIPLTHLSSTRIDPHRSLTAKTTICWYYLRPSPSYPHYHRHRHHYVDLLLCSSTSTPTSLSLLR